MYFITSYLSHSELRKPCISIRTKIILRYKKVNQEMKFLEIIRIIQRFSILDRERRFIDP